MTLSAMMTATATTKRATLSSGKRGDPTTHLESVSIVPIMLSDTRGQHAIRQAIGLEGSAAQMFETYTESHAHTDDSSPVTQVPDIIAGDRLVSGGITYIVRWCEQQPATSGFGATLLIYLTEDKRA